MIKCNHKVGDVLRCKQTLQTYNLTGIGNTLAILEIETKEGNKIEVSKSIVDVNELEKYLLDQAIYFQFRALWMGEDAHRKELNNFHVTDNDVLITLSRTAYMKRFLEADNGLAGAWLHQNALIIGKHRSRDANNVADPAYMMFRSQHQDEPINYYVMGYFYKEGSDDMYFDAKEFLPSIKTMDEIGLTVKLPNDMSNEELGAMTGQAKLKGCIVTKK